MLFVCQIGENFDQKIIAELSGKFKYSACFVMVLEKIRIS